jgi:aspartyl-tRNA synthetase
MIPQPAMALAVVPRIMRSSTVQHPVAFQRFLAPTRHSTFNRYRSRPDTGFSFRLSSTSSSNSDPPPSETALEDRDAVQAAREARKYVHLILQASARIRRWFTYSFHTFYCYFLSRAEKERLKAEKKAKQEAAANASAATETIFAPVEYLSIDDQDSYPRLGDMARIMSRSRTGRHFVEVADLAHSAVPGSVVWLCGRIHSIRIKGGSCFLVLRQDSFHTVQCVYFKDKENPEQSKQFIDYLKTLTVESVVQVEGTIIGDVEVKSCSVSNIELGIQRIHAVSKADAILPFLVEDASRSEAEVEASQENERPFPRLGQELRLDHRWMDLRAPANNAILRIQSAVCQLFRESLYEQGFVEIHTPKLIAGESESGAGVFTTDYFGTTACLAQSPQLYKQLAIVSDFQRVFEIGPVFRAENSNTRRHLCEFTGLDLEMAINDHYMETLTVVHTMFKHIFHGLETRWARELAIIREQYASEPVTFTDEPCVIHWPEAMSILNEKGFDMGDELQDLTGAMELALGQAIKEKYGTDFFMLDQYPSQIRPFYTMPSPVDGRYSNSYDMFVRGQEICSGAQRCHDPNLVLNLIQQKGIVVHDDGLLHKYVESFRHGVQPHAGAGIGLERVVFLYLGLDNVRKASMFPRDPNRCVP